MAGKSKPEFLRYPNCTCESLRRATRVMTQAFDAALQPVDLTTTQFTTLAVLNGGGPLSVSELASHLVTDRTTVNRNLKPLKRRSLIREEIGEDQRQRLLSLTELGRETFKQAVPHWTKAQVTIVDRLGLDRWTRLIDDLKAIPPPER